MTEQNAQNEPRYVLASMEKLSMARALNRDYEAFLAPGERLSVEGAATEEYVHAQLSLRSADRSTQLDVEAVIMPKQDLKAWQEHLGDKEFMDLLFGFLRVQLYEFFRQDRSLRFHVDWRLFPFEGYTVRFRGAFKRPELIDQADALLEQHDAME